MTTYDKIELLLEATKEVLLAKMETNRQISIHKFRELKDDMEELKVHAKETNGHINDNKQSIVLLEEKQHQESKRRIRMRAFSLVGFTTIFGAIVAWIVNQFSQ